MEEAASVGWSAGRFAFAVLAALEGAALLLFLADRLLGVALPFRLLIAGLAVPPPLLARLLFAGVLFASVLFIGVLFIGVPFAGEARRTGPRPGVLASAVAVMSAEDGRIVGPQPAL